MENKEMVAETKYENPLIPTDYEEKQLNHSIENREELMQSIEAQESKEEPVELSERSAVHIANARNEGSFEVNYIEDHEDTVQTSLESEEYKETNYKEVPSILEEKPTAPNKKLEEPKSVLSKKIYALKAIETPLEVSEEYLSTLTLVQRNIIKMELEIARQRKSLAEEWSPPRKSTNDPYKYKPVKGGQWIKTSERRTGPQNRRGFFSKLFKCLRPL